MDHGTYIEHEGRPALRFERTYRRPVSRLWEAITDPGELSHWFPSKVSMQPRAGGTIEFSGDPNLGATMTGTILVYDPPRRLAYTWGTDELHFELRPDGDDGCTLTFINVLEARDTAARSAAGWTVCLAELGKHLSGLVAEGPHSDGAESWKSHYDAYLAEGMPSGAPIPGMDSTD
ncbi:SRPBCC family protein [Sphaerisporangium perillae]|uniref:SRPBCC family protein n=1 Tax=Sphaerisporangium perillae TaxID=2935860 RepID=UPI00200CA927|nr:SRPBCC family protein [Sphaerisporangium perillae]